MDRSAIVLTGALIFAAGASAQTTATVSINPTASTTAVGTSFLGLSLVTSETEYVVGSYTTPNPYFLTLTKNLTQYANGHFEIRELNDKATNTQTTHALQALTTYYNTMSTQPNGGVAYFIGVDFADDVAAGGGSNGTAATQAAYIASNLPSGSILSWEVGNEPDYYLNTGVRTGTWNYATYKTQYENTRTSIVNEGLGIPMDAPVFSGSNTNGICTTTNVEDFATNESSHLGLFDLHYYGGNACNGNTEAADYLMTEPALNKSTMVSSPNNLSGILSAMHAASLYNFRIGELNSIACQGQSGVSDTFQSALWFLDEAMNYAQAGASGINVFSIAAASYYSPFVFGHTGTNPSYTYSISRINPLYYGMLTEAIMLQSNAALIPVTLTTSKHIKAYATKDSANNIRLLIINKEETTSGDGNVVLTMTGGGNASLWKLLATGGNTAYAVSDYTTTGGVPDQITIAGQTFKGSTDGTLQGTASHPTVVPTGSTYTINVPHTSAVIVKIPLS
jgi:hypothetical protein